MSTSYQHQTPPRYDEDVFINGRNMKGKFMTREDAARHGFVYRVPPKYPAGTIINGRNMGGKFIIQRHHRPENRVVYTASGPY